MTAPREPTPPTLIQTKQWRKIYCSECHRFLCTALRGSVVQIKCPKCKAADVYEAA